MMRIRVVARRRAALIAAAVIFSACAGAARDAVAQTHAAPNAPNASNAAGTAGATGATGAAGAGAAGTGTISGTAIDETGAAVANVRVMVTNDATALTRENTTGAEGTFTLPMLPAGRYTLRADHAGFAPHEMTGITVAADQQVTVRVELKVDSLNEAVVVAAQKRGEERLRDVPVPVSVINTEALSETSQVQLRNYYARVPGLSIAPIYLAQQSLTIRGITSGGSDPTVGIVVDDVPYGMSIDGAGGNVVPDFDPGDLARIEVLRGPQGVLFGANSMGGLVRYVTKDPSFERRSGRVELGTSSVHNSPHPVVSLRASIAMPLSKTFAIRASGFTRQDPGYIDNPVAGIRGINDGVAAGGMLSAFWRPSDRVSLKLGGFYQHLESNGLGEVEAEAGLGDLQQNYLRETGETRRTYQVYSGVLRVKLGVGTELTSVTGYNVNQLTSVFDRSYQWGSIAQTALGVQGAPYYIERPMKKFTQEVRLSGTLRRKIEWLAGGFFNHEDGPYLTHADAMDTRTFQTVGRIFDFNLPRSFNQRALFGGVTYYITPRFDVQIGGRVSSDDLDVPAYQATGPVAAVAFGRPSPVLFERSGFEGSTFTHLVSPRVKVSNDLMIYGRVSSGYRPGAPNFTLPDVPAQSKPDKTQNYEVGLKGSFLGERLGVDASVYYIDWSDIQLSVRNASTGIAYFSNGGAAKSEGVELSLNTAPLTGLTVNGWIAYNNAVLTKDFPPGPLFGRVGDRLPSSPRRSGNLYAQYVFPLWRRTAGFAGGDVTYVGDRVSIFQGSANRQQLPAYTQTDLRLGVKTDAWTATLFINNLADRRGLINGGIGYLPPNAFVYTQPRTIGLSLARNF